MKKLNMYYYGEYRSHRSYCWESSDKVTWVLLTSLTLIEMKEKLNDYCDFNKWVGYKDFFNYVSSESEDFEENAIYPCILLEIEGSSYAPDIQGSLLTELEYDATDYLDPKNEVRSWDRLSKEWAEEENKKQLREIAEKKRKEKNAERQRKYRANKKEFKDYQELKKKWEGVSEAPKEPEYEDKPKIKLDPEKLTAFGKFLEDYKKGVSK